MNQIERVYRIDKLLSTQARPAKALQQELEISPSTLKRDIEYMRSRLHAPIVFDRHIAAYRYDLSSTTSKNYALPGLWFSENEIHALLTLQHLLEKIEPSGLMKQHIQPLTTRLEQLLGDKTTPSEAIRQRVHIVGLGKRTGKSIHFEQIGHALVNRRRLNIRYLARSTDETTQREVSPLRLIHYRENWYLDAWCHQRNALRNFSVDAIEQLEILDTPAKEIPMNQVEAVFGEGYGIFTGNEINVAKLRFSPTRARWVANEQWHIDQQGKYDSEGYFLLEIPYSDHRELTMDILKHGPDCEVLEPAELRQHVAQQIKAMGEKYSG
jgi:predicted DNA-binding transcriptional regulator YafY